LRGDRAKPSWAVAVRNDSVGLSGARPIGIAAQPTNPDTAKTSTGPSRRNTEPARPASVAGRPTTPTTPRGSTTVAGRSRIDTAVARRPADRRLVVSPALSPALVPIRRFAAAVQSGDVEQIKKAYPGMTENQRRNWETAFRGAKPEEAQIIRAVGVSGPDPGPNKTTVIDFTMTVRFSHRQTGDIVHVSSRYRATLRLEGGALVLQSLAERPR
jgi:hypothetical protein